MTSPYDSWRIQYLADRQQLDDTTLWQGPALALAAQAFLLGTALGNEAPPFNRVVAALLAFLTALAAIHLIWRKRREGRKIAEELSKLLQEKYSVTYGIEHLHVGAAHKWPAAPLSAHVVWMATLALFAAADCVVVVLAWAKCPLLGTY